MRTSLAELFDKGVVLLDGGMGSSLIARGLESGRPPETWNLERPDDVREIHAAYAAAGSAVVQTNTFGGSVFTLKKHGLDKEMEEINRAGARIAREAVEASGAAGAKGARALVAGNIGPSGEMLSPVGVIKPAELVDGFARQAAALAEGGADYISIETMIDLKEAICALKAVREATDLPATACLTFEKKKRGFFTLMGNQPGDSMKALADEGALAAGANCSIGSDAMAELCSLLVGSSAKPASSAPPVIVKPNAGLPEMEGSRAVYRQEPADFARDGAAMVRLGARAVGGCCGTDARFIAALKSELDKLSGEDGA